MAFLRNKIFIFMSDKEVFLTKEKYEELVEELNRLKTDKRREIAENLEYSKSLGDLSENAEYHEARAAQAEVEDKISRLEAMLKSVSIVSGKHGEKAEIGSKVVLEKESSGEKISYTIVSSEESDLASNKISSVSPLGSAIVGKKKGDKITLKTPKGSVGYVIVSLG